MDRSKTRGRKIMPRLATLGTMFLIGVDLHVHGFVGAWAQAPAPASATGALTWGESVNQTLSRGIPTVLIVTSKRAPQTENLARTIMASPSAGRLRGLVNVAELCAEDEPEQAKRLMVTQYPTIVAFRRGAKGQLETVASRRGVMSAEELSGWLSGVGLLSAAVQPSSSRTDPDVIRTGHQPYYGPAPSPQYAPPPPPYKAYPAPPPPPAPLPPPPTIEREVTVERPVEREIVIERPVEREVVREVAPREVVREVVAERAAAPERVREVVVERIAAPAAPRNVLTRPAPARERGVPERVREVVVERAAPRQVVVERAAAPERVREVVVERAAAPERVREVMVERAAAPREVVAERAAPAEVRAVEEERPTIALIRPGLLGRAIGGAGERIRRIGLPRVEVAVETQRIYRLAPPREKAVSIAEAAPPPSVVEAAPRAVYAPAPPPPVCYPPPAPPIAPSPQFMPPPPTPGPSPQSH